MARWLLAVSFVFLFFISSVAAIGIDNPYIPLVKPSPDNLIEGANYSINVNDTEHFDGYTVAELWSYYTGLGNALWYSVNNPFSFLNSTTINPVLETLGYNETTELTTYYDERYLTGQLEMYFYNTTSPINSSYTVMNTTLPSGAEQRNSFTGLTDGDNFLTKRLFADFNLSILETGAYNQHTTIDYISGTKDVQMKSELYILKANGTEILIGESPASTILSTGIQQQVIWTGTIDSETIFAEGDYLTMYLYATVSGLGSAPSIDLVVADATAARLDIGINPTDISITEVDPIWEAEKGSYWNSTELLNGTLAKSSDLSTYFYDSINVSHDDTTGFVTNEHIDWTNAVSNFLTTGTVSIGTSTIQDLGTYTQLSDSGTQNFYFPEGVRIERGATSVLGGTIQTYDSANDGLMVSSEGTGSNRAAWIASDYTGTGSSSAQYGGNLFAQAHGTGTLSGLFIANFVASRVTSGLVTTAEGLLADVVINGGAGDITNGYAVHGKVRTVAAGNIANGRVFYAEDGTASGGGSIDELVGVYIDLMTAGDINYGIWDDGNDWIMDGDNSKLIQGEGQDTELYDDGTNYIIDRTTGGIVYVVNNLSAENLFDRSAYWNKSLGNALEFMQDTTEINFSDENLNDFERVEYPVADISRPVEVPYLHEVCIDQMEDYVSQNCTMIFDGLYFQPQCSEKIVKVPALNCTLQKDYLPIINEEDNKTILGYEEIEVEVCVELAPICTNETYYKTEYPYNKTEYGRHLSAVAGKHEQALSEINENINLEDNLTIFSNSVLADHYITNTTKDPATLTKVENFYNNLGTKTYQEMKDLVLTPEGKLSDDVLFNYEQSEIGSYNLEAIGHTNRAMSVLMMWKIKQNEDRLTEIEATLCSQGAAKYC